MLSVKKRYLYKTPWLDKTNQNCGPSKNFLFDPRLFDWCCLYVAIIGAGAGVISGSLVVIPVLPFWESFRVSSVVQADMVCWVCGCEEAGLGDHIRGTAGDSFQRLTDTFGLVLPLWKSWTTQTPIIPNPHPKYNNSTVPFTNPLWLFSFGFVCLALSFCLPLLCFASFFFLFAFASPALATVLVACGVTTSLAASASTMRCLKIFEHEALAPLHCLTCYILLWSSHPTCWVRVFGLFFLPRLTVSIQPAEAMTVGGEASASTRPGLKATQNKASRVWGASHIQQTGRLRESHLNSNCTWR